MLFVIPIIQPLFLFVGVYHFFLLKVELVKDKHFRYLDVWMSSNTFSIREKETEYKIGCARFSFVQYRKMLRNKTLTYENDMYLRLFRLMWMSRMTSDTFRNIQTVSCTEPLSHKWLK